MNPTLYIFALPKAVNGMTHVAVEGESRNAGRINIIGVFGKDLNRGFKPGQMMSPFQMNIAGDNLIDLDEKSLSLGRPSTKPRYKMDSSDIAAWLEEDPITIQTRIDTRTQEN